jgi:adenylate cyclase
MLEPMLIKMPCFKISLLKKKWTPRSKRRISHAGVLIAAGGLFTLIIALVQPFYTFNLWFSDQFSSSGDSSSNIVIAGIDDTTLAQYGKWSEWPRNLNAQAVRNLEAAGASVIGFDVLFNTNSSNDQAFAQSLQQAGDVVLAAAGTTIITTKGEAISFEDFLLPDDSLYQADSNVGHVNVIPDPDGKVRQIPLIVQNDGNTYPALSVAMLLTLFHENLPISYPIVDGKFNILMRNIPVNSSYSMRLNYAVVDSKPTYISYDDIINNDFNPSLVKNKIILIGMTATGNSDQWAGPNSSVQLPGVYIHAAAIDTILRMAFLTEESLNTTLLIMLLLTILCAVLLSTFGTWHWTDVLKGTVFIMILLLIYVVILSFMADRGYVMNILYPFLLLLVIYVTNALFMVIREQTDKSFVKELFGKYVSPQISKKIVGMANEGGLKLGGEEREVTVLFADIRNFTNISEQMEPEDVVRMLNTCLPVVIESIVQNGGLVNKFAGDNLMGVWNAPDYQPDHAKLAIKAALEAQNKLMKLAETNSAMNGIQFGIGINTGKALAGNVGSLGRVEYTVIGDEVNLASRICSVTPGIDVYIGPETYNQTERYFSTEALEPQLFKGKTKPIRIYRVIGWLFPSSP